VSFKGNTTVADDEAPDVFTRIGVSSYRAISE
jgi:hypothetical protein